MNRAALRQWKRAIMADPDLTPVEKRVALALAKHADPSGRVVIVETSDEAYEDEHGGAT